MTIREILKITEHRPGTFPTGKWKYYQEWNKAVFIHWRVDYGVLRKLVPEDLEIDLYKGEAWVSLVAFTMKKIRPRNLPAFPPVSDFDEINIRTYVRYKDKQGVYFLSIEGGNKISCQVAKGLSELPYRYSKILRQESEYHSRNKNYNDKLELRYKVGKHLTDKSELDKWLTERYALFQDTEQSLNEFEIHHMEWPANEVELLDIKVDYPRFNKLLNNLPDIKHYSTGVQVLAWNRKKNKKQATARAMLQKVESRT